MEGDAGHGKVFLRNYRQEQVEQHQPQPQPQQAGTTGLSRLPEGYAVNEFGGVYKIGSTRTYQEKLQVAQTYTAITNNEGAPPPGVRLARETKQSIGFCKRVIKEMEEKGYVDLPYGSVQKFGHLTEEAKASLIDWYSTEPQEPYRTYASRLEDRFGIKCSLATICKFFQTHFPKGRKRGPPRQHTPPDPAAVKYFPNRAAIGAAPRDDDGNPVKRAGLLSLPDEAKKMLIRWNKEEPNETYKNYQARMLKMFGVTVSLSTISIFLKKYSDGPRKRGPRGPRKKQPEEIAAEIREAAQDAQKTVLVPEIAPFPPLKPPPRKFTMPEPAKLLLCKWNKDEPQVPYRIYQLRLKEQCGVDVSLATISEFLKFNAQKRYRRRKRPLEDGKTKADSDAGVLMCGTYAQAKKIIDLEQENKKLRHKLEAAEKQEQENIELKVQVGTLSSQVDTLMEQVTALQDLIQEQQMGIVVRGRQRLA